MYNHNMHHSSQLTPHKPSSCFFKQYNQKKKKKQTLSEEFREPKSGAEKHWSADNEWKKHCGYSSWSSLNSGTLRKEVVLSGYLHVLFLLDFISQCDDKTGFSFCLFLLLSFLFELFTECPGSCSAAPLDVDSWLLLYLARCREIPVWVCWKMLCP